jgi:hypothetical protein
MLHARPAGGTYRETIPNIELIWTFLELTLISSLRTEAAPTYEGMSHYSVESKPLLCKLCNTIATPLGMDRDSAANSFCSLDDGRDPLAATAAVIYPMV